MAIKPVRKVAFVSSFLPRKCGIATFTSDLIKNTTAAADKGFEPLVIAMSNDKIAYNDPVKFEIRHNIKSDYICAAEYVNFSDVQVVSLQHEFGLFGGKAGSYLNLFLQKVNAPVISTLHTILDEPSPDYYQSMIDVCDASCEVIVMNERGIEMLRRIYGVPENKIRLISHGIPDLPFVDSSYYKHKFGFEGRKTILTFGLLGRSKGVEVMLRAMPDIIKADPTVIYVVLGATHPEVLKYEGDSYRFELQRIVKDLQIHENVIFHNRFVSDAELNNWLCAADIYVTPYLQAEQLTSGTLSFAVGAGKSVVSTPYWAAAEHLAEGRGKLVDFGDSQGMSEAIIEIMKDTSLFHSMRRRAYDYGRNMTWPVIGQAYWKMFTARKLGDKALPKPQPTVRASSILEMPEPPLDHVQRLTDNTGIFQHAQFTIPNLKHGYCTDDNARALVAMTRYYAQYSEPQALKLFEIYLSFICHAQQPDGKVLNFMCFGRHWLENEPLHDALGRVLWAFGTVMAHPPWPAYLPIVKQNFDASAALIPRLSIRGMAYAAFGIIDYLKQFPGASEIKRLLALIGKTLVESYQRSVKADWDWFEDTITYDNAILSAALFVAGQTLEDESYIKIAKKTCDFLLNCTFNGEHFSFVGCNGWYKYGGKRAAFDQQPIEVSSTIMMLQAAHRATDEDKYLKLQRNAFDWFLGENDLHIPLYDFRTKGCCDGLEQAGVNINQGAESMISFLQSLLCVGESYTATKKSKATRPGPDTKLKANEILLREITTASTRNAKTKLNEKL